MVAINMPVTPAPPVVASAAPAANAGTGASHGARPIRSFLQIVAELQQQQQAMPSGLASGTPAASNMPGVPTTPTTPTTAATAATPVPDASLANMMLSAMSNARSGAISNQLANAKAPATLPVGASNLKVAVKRSDLPAPPLAGSTPVDGDPSQSQRAVAPLPPQGPVQAADPLNAQLQLIAPPVVVVPELLKMPHGNAVAPPATTITGSDIPQRRQPAQAKLSPLTDSTTPTMAAAVAPAAPNTNSAQQKKGGALPPRALLQSALPNASDSAAGAPAPVNGQPAPSRTTKFSAAADASSADTPAPSADRANHTPSVAASASAPATAPNIAPPSDAAAATIMPPVAPIALAAPSYASAAAVAAASAPLNGMVSHASDGNNAGAASVTPGSRQESVEHLQSIVERATFVQNPNGSEMHIGLRSEALGQVDVHTVLRSVPGSTVGASISVQDQAAHDLLSRELPALQSHLQDRNINVHLDEIKVIPDSLTGGSGGGMQQGTQQGSSNGSSGDPQRAPFIATAASVADARTESFDAQPARAYGDGSRLSVRV